MLVEAVKQPVTAEELQMLKEFALRHDVAVIISSQTPRQTVEAASWDNVFALCGGGEGEPVFRVMKERSSRVMNDAAYHPSQYSKFQSIKAF